MMIHQKSPEEVLSDIDELSLHMVLLSGRNRDYAAFIILQALWKIYQNDLQEMKKITEAFLLMKESILNEYQEEQKSRGNGEARRKS